MQAEGGPAYDLLRVEQPAVLQPYGFKGTEVHLLPLVPDIIAAVHPQQRLLVATPPDGGCWLVRQIQGNNTCVTRLACDKQPKNSPQYALLLCCAVLDFVVPRLLHVALLWCYTHTHIIYTQVCWTLAGVVCCSPSWPKSCCRMHQHQQHRSAALVPEDKRQRLQQLASWLEAGPSLK